jgi:hypothetical protein
MSVSVGTRLGRNLRDDLDLPDYEALMAQAVE